MALDESLPVQVRAVCPAASVEMVTKGGNERLLDLDCYALLSFFARMSTGYFRADSYCCPYSYPGLSCRFLFPFAQMDSWNAHSSRHRWLDSTY